MSGVPATNDDLLDRMQYRGAKREVALHAVQAQLDAWSIAPPQVEPLLLDFGLDDWERVGLTELWICNETGAGYCGKYMFVQSGQQCPPHSHRVKHETFFVLQGKLKVMLDGQAIMLSPGNTQAIAPRRVHSFEAIDGPALLLELSMPCDINDNLFVNEKTNAWLKGAMQQ